MKKDNARADNRPERIPVYRQRAFQGEQREGYVRRWVADLPGRIDMFKAAGWTMVEGDSATTHDGLAQVETQLGSVVSRVVNKQANADYQNQYLMEIPEEWYAADQADKQKNIDATLADATALKPNQYGSFNIK